MLSSVADFFVPSVRKILLGVGSALESVVVVQLLLEAMVVMACVVNRQRRIHVIVCVSAEVSMNILYLQNNVNCLGSVTKMFACTCRHVKHTRVQLCTSDYPCST
jgi:hypothetical protein